MKKILLILLVLSPLALRGAVATNPIVAATPTAMTNIVLAITAPQTNALYQTLTNQLAASTNTFVSPKSHLGVTITNYTHGLGRTPTEVRLVLVCTNADAMSGYSAGDEVPAWAMFDIQNISPIGTVWGNATTVGYHCEVISARTRWEIQNKNAAGPAGYVGDITNFNLKIYAR